MQDSGFLRFDGPDPGRLQIPAGYLKTLHAAQPGAAGARIQFHLRLAGPDGPVSDDAHQRPPGTSAQLGRPFADTLPCEGAKGAFHYAILEGVERDYDKSPSGTDERD
jgi:hypothetical protein